MRGAKHLVVVRVEGCEPATTESLRLFLLRGKGGPHATLQLVSPGSAAPCMASADKTGLVPWDEQTDIIASYTVVSHIADRKKKYQQDRRACLRRHVLHCVPPLESGLNVADAAQTQPARHRHRQQRSTSPPGTVGTIGATTAGGDALRASDFSALFQIRSLGNPISRFQTWSGLPEPVSCRHARALQGPS